MAPPKAVQVIPADGLGGVEVVAKSAAKAGVIEVVALKECGLWGTRSFRAASRALGADIAIFSLWKSLPAMALARLLNPSGRLVAMVHADRPAHMIDAAATWAMCRLASEVWGDCGQVLSVRKRTVGSKPTRAISFLPDHMPRVVCDDPKPRFVFWGRIDPVKRLDEAVRPIVALRARGIKARLDIYGPDCGGAKALRVEIDRWKAEDQIHIHGQIERERLPEIARDASFFILPSKQEGAAISALEAMQLGLVPVVSPVGAMVEYARFGHAYRGVVPAADWLADVIANPARYRELSRGAASFASGFPSHAESLAAACHASLAPAKSSRALRAS